MFSISCFQLMFLMHVACPICMDIQLMYAKKLNQDKGQTIIRHLPPFNALYTNPIIPAESLTESTRTSPLLII